MEKLNCIIAFVKAAEHLSFVGAARDLGVSASAVGKNIAQLEEKLGVRLLQRTTRRINLTQEGALFHERCRRILDDLEDAKSMMLNTLDAPRGKLRVTLPTIGYRFLLPALPRFLQSYPELELDLDFSDKLVDLVEEGKDVAIRGGNLSDSRFMTRRAGPFRFVIVGAPEYLKQHGTPTRPEDLAIHSCLRFRYPNSGKLQEWALQIDGKSAPRLKTDITCNNMEAVLAAAIQGLGLAYMPDFLARDALDRGLLTSVLEDFITNPGEFWIVWPSSQHLSPKLRVFLDFMSSELFTRECQRLPQHGNS